MYCPNCGSKNKDDAQFCESCGTKIGLMGTQPSPASQQAATTPPPSYHGESGKPSTIIVVLGYIFALLGGLIGIILGLYLYSKDNHEAKTHGRNILIIAAVMMVLGILISGWVGSMMASSMYDSSYDYDYGDYDSSNYDSSDYDSSDYDSSGYDASQDINDVRRDAPD